MRTAPLHCTLSSSPEFTVVVFCDCLNSYRMLALRLTVLCLLFCGSYGSLFSWFNNCNPPQTIVGKFCGALFDNDVDDDGDIDSKDFDYDGITYNFDDKLCDMTKWELVMRWKCRYGMSEEYGRFLYDRFNDNSVGVDFSQPVLFNHQEFLQLQYTRFKDAYCSVPANRENKIDRVLCAEVDALKPEDLKCD